MTLWHPVHSLVASRPQLTQDCCGKGWRGTCHTETNQGCHRGATEVLWPAGMPEQWEKLPFPKIPSAHQPTTNRPSGLWIHPQRPTLLALLAGITLENGMHLCFPFYWAGSPPKLWVDTEWSWKSISTTPGKPPSR